MLLYFLSPITAFAAISIPFTVNLSENVTVDTTGGTPRIAVDVGGVTRYATYTSGSGTAALTFTYDAVLGDVDLDGVTLSSPVQLNGGTMKDAVGNDATLTFTIPNTSGVKVNYPSLGMDFVYDADGRYTLNGTAYNDLSSFLTAAGGTFTRASVGTYFDATGTLQTASSGTPRFDHDPVTHAAKGILIEEARTNLLPRNTEFEHAAWVKASVTISTNATTDPSGALTAEKLVATAASSTHLVYQTSAITAASSYSVFVKPAEYNFVQVYGGRAVGPTATERFSVVVNLTTGTVDSLDNIIASQVSIIPVSNGFYRIAIAGFTGYSSGTTFLAVCPIPSAGLPRVGNNKDISYLGDGVSGIYVWGAQVEQGEFPTSYIQTGAAAVSRVTDSLSMPTGSWFNAAEGTLFSQFIPNATFAGYPEIALFGDGTTTNFIAYTLFPGNNLRMEWKQSASTLFNLIGGVASAALTAKSALAYKSASSAGSFNGGAPTTSAVATLTLPITTFSIGSNLARGGGDGLLTGTIEKLKYYPFRPTNTQLQLLTQ